IPAVNLDNMGLTGLDLSTEDSAREGIDRIKEALTFVNTVRGQLGAYQNRLENTDRRLDITEENMTAAYSRIMDVDMAEEMTKYSTYTVMTQAGTSVLAQANDRPSTVLQLLQ
ncbi:MAG: flagellin FliC3, partial [Lachnospiraceae bacterium]|nr:flagellin FliC3 [Lachnospiraceae bacterium]